MTPRDAVPPVVRDPIRSLRSRCRARLRVSASARSGLRASARVSEPALPLLIAAAENLGRRSCLLTEDEEARHRRGGRVVPRSWARRPSPEPGCASRLGSEPPAHLVGEARPSARRARRRPRLRFGTRSPKGCRRSRNDQGSCASRRGRGRLDGLVERLLSPARACRAGPRSVGRSRSVGARRRLPQYRTRAPSHRGSR